jgi:hypothetical protein
MSALAAAVLAFTVAAPAGAPSGPVRAPAAPAAPRVVEGDGFRAELPPRFRPETRTVDDRPVHLGVSPDGRSLVTVSSVAGAGPLRCDADETGASEKDDGLDAGGGGEEDGEESGEEEDRDGDRSMEPEDSAGALAPEARPRARGAAPLVELSTARGLAGCALVTGGPEGGALALVVLGAGEVRVIVNAVAADAVEARRLARAVADSVVPTRRAGPTPGLALPEADPRLVGCFDRVRGVGSIDNGTRIFDRRCFRADFTYVSRRDVWATSTSYVPGREHARDVLARSSASLDAPERTGTWWVEDEILTVEPDDGEPEVSRVVVGDGGFILGGELWERQR